MMCRALSVLNLSTGLRWAKTDNQCVYHADTVFAGGVSIKMQGQLKNCPFCREAVWSAAPWYGRHMHQGNTTPQNCDKCNDNILSGVEHSNWANDENLPSSDVHTNSVVLKNNAVSKDAISLTQGVVTDQ